MPHKSVITVCITVLLVGGCSKHGGTLSAVQRASDNDSLRYTQSAETGPFDTVDIFDTCIVVFEPSDSIYMSLPPSSQALLSTFEFNTASLCQEVKHHVPTSVTDARYLKMRAGKVERVLDTRTELSVSQSDFGVILLAGSRKPVVRKGLVSDSEYLPLVKAFYALDFSVDSALRSQFKLSENDDTLLAPEKSVVVFQPTEAQEESLEEPYQDAVEYYSDFNEYTGRLKTELTGKLPVLFSSARYIRLRGKNAKVFDTKEVFNRKIGSDARVLFFNGDKSHN